MYQTSLSKLLIGCAIYNYVPIICFLYVYNANRSSLFVKDKRVGEIEYEMMTRLQLQIKSSSVSLPRNLHYYRMDLLSRAVTAFSPGYRAGTTIPGLKVPPLVPGHRAGTKEGPPTGTKGPPAEQTWPHPLVPVGNPKRD